MIQLEIGGKRVPVAAGETIIGSAPGSAIVLEGEGVRPRHAVVQGTIEGAAAIRSADPEAELLINGIRLSTDPTPVLHGDKIQIGGHEILVVDPRRAGHTQLFDSGAFADLVPPQAARPTAGATGGRLVCLTDGREYTVGSAPLVFGRDASADVVVSGNDVSRRHAEIQTSAEGYGLMDLSVNGTYVNGQRIGRSHLLARADVIRIGNDEFRFYADAAASSQLERTPRPAPPSEPPLRPPTGAAARLSDTLQGLPVAQLQSAVTPRASQAPLASLLVRSGELKGRRFAIKVPVVNIGRADYNDVVIADPSVSTTHAKLQRRDDIWVLSDLGSTNGTFVEGEAVTEETALSPGSTLRFGDVAVLFEPFDDRAPAVRPAATQAMERVEPAPAPEPGAVGVEAEGVAPVERPAPRRRPIRATAPRPSGPPAWLIAVLLLLGIVIVYFILAAS